MIKMRPLEVYALVIYNTIAASPLASKLVKIKHKIKICKKYFFGRRWVHGFSPHGAVVVPPPALLVLVFKKMGGEFYVF